MGTTKRVQFFPTAEDERVLVRASKILKVSKDALAKAAFSRGLQLEIDARADAAKELSRATGNRR